MNRDHQLFLFLLHKYAFQTTQTTFAYSNPLSGTYERMERERSLLLKEELQIFNLLRGYGNHDPAKAHESDQSGRSQNRVPRISNRIDLHERVSGEKRNRYYLPPVAPCVMFGQQREEDIKAPVIKLCGDFLLESMSRFYREPLRQSTFHNGLRRRRFSPSISGRASAIATAH